MREAAGTARELHNLFAIPIFVGIPAAAVLSARSFAKSGASAWALYSRASALLMATTVVLSGAAFGQTRGWSPGADSFNASRSPQGSVA
jgi:hypothetical protein